MPAEPSGIILITVIIITATMQPAQSIQLLRRLISCMGAIICDNNGIMADSGGGSSVFEPLTVDPVP